MLDLSIIILNYKTPDLTRQCIESIHRETEKYSFEIIVVDNNSEDNSREIILSKFPDVNWVQLLKNIGFAGGNYEGVKHARGEFILLLNSDTLIVDHGIEKSLAYFKNLNDKTIAVLGCRLLSGDGKLQYSSYPKLTWPSLKKTFLQNILAGKLLLLLGIGLEKKNLDNIYLHQHSHFSDSIAGSFMLYNPSIIEKTGFMDPDFFMYFEEIEWQNRILKKGFRIIYYNEASIIHLHGGSSGNFEVKTKQALVSQGMFILKRYGHFGCLFYLLMLYCNLIAGLIFYPLLSSKTKNEFKKWKKNFLGTQSEHLQLLFRYKKRQASGNKPLRAASQLSFTNKKSS